MTMLKYGVDPKILSVRSGVDHTAEQQAEELLRKHRDTAPTDYVFLSEDQLDLRARREIGNQIGVADASLVAGMYRRDHNPLLGSRPGKQGRSHDDG